MQYCSASDWLRIKKPAKTSRKGQNGRLLIAAGNEKYHGSAILAILAAIRFCDLVYFHSTQENAAIAKTYLRAIKSATPCVICGKKGELARHMRIADAILIGPGIGRGRAAGALVAKAVAMKKPIILDADALHLVKPSHLHPNCLLTPHEGEFRALFGMPGSAGNVIKMAKKYKCVILKKGPIDIVASPSKTKFNRTHNSGMTKGGTGDVLAGLAAALVSAGNPPYLAACAAAYLNGYAGNLLYYKLHFHFSAHDLANELADAAAKIEGA